MEQHTPSLDLTKRFQGTTTIITGSARGIGAATATILNSYGSNVVITDLPILQTEASSLIKSLTYPEKALFVAASVTDWKQLNEVFKTARKHFGRIDFVVANAGIMESRPILDFDVDDNDDPVESEEANRVIDVNLKGTLNTVRLSAYYMRNNEMLEHGDRGAIVLVTSTSGYFGATGNVAYVSSKHGVVGLLRACQPMAQVSGIRINAVAPSFTPTHITSGFGDSIQKAGIHVNTPETIGMAIAHAAVAQDQHGLCHLVAGSHKVELEQSLQSLMPEWIGTGLLETMARLGTVIMGFGGYPLPATSPTQPS